MLTLAVKLYQEEGTKGFYAAPKRGGPRVLKPDVVEKVEKLLGEGMSESDIAKQLDLKIDTLKKAIKRGVVKKKSIK